jgi:hypothetical protein
MDENIIKRQNTSDSEEVDWDAIVFSGVLSNMYSKGVNSADRFYRDKLIKHNNFWHLVQIFLILMIGGVLALFLFSVKRPDALGVEGISIEQLELMELRFKRQLDIAVFYNLVITFGSLTVYFEWLSRQHSAKKSFQLHLEKQLLEHRAILDKLIEHRQHTIGMSKRAPKRLRGSNFGFRGYDSA